MAQNHDLVAQCHHYVQILTHKQNTHTVLLLVVEDIVDCIGGIDVQATDRVSGDDDIGASLDLTAQKHLLDIAAGETADRGFRRGRHNFQIPDDLLRVCAAGLPVNKETPGVGVLFQDHIVCNGHGRSQAHTQTVFGNEGHGDALFHDGSGR